MADPSRGPIGFLAGAIDAATTFAPSDYRAGTARMSQENLPHNLALIELARTWAERKSATPGSWPWPG